MATLCPSRTLGVPHDAGSSSGTKRTDRHLACTASGTLSASRAPASYRLPEAGIEGEDEGVRLPETVRRIASCARDPIQTSPKAAASSTGWRAQ